MQLAMEYGLSKCTSISCASQHSSQMIRFEFATIHLWKMGYLRKWQGLSIQILRMQKSKTGLSLTFRLKQEANSLLSAPILSDSNWSLSSSPRWMVLTLLQFCFSLETLGTWLYITAGISPELTSGTLSPMRVSGTQMRPWCCLRLRSLRLAVKLLNRSS